MVTHVATLGDEVAEFSTIRVESPSRAELLHLSVGAQHWGTGVGSALVRHSEKRILELRAALELLHLDTAVPTYDQSLWERMGYPVVEPSLCEYPTGAFRQCVWRSA